MTSKQVNGHDHQAPAVPELAASKLTRQVVVPIPGLPPRLIYLRDGQYVGEISYVAFGLDNAAAMGEDFAAYMRDSIGAVKKMQTAPRIARPTLDDVGNLLKGS